MLSYTDGPNGRLQRANVVAEMLNGSSSSSVTIHTARDPEEASMVYHALIQKLSEGEEVIFCESFFELEIKEI